MLHCKACDGSMQLKWVRKYDKDENITDQFLEFLCTDCLTKIRLSPDADDGLEELESLEEYLESHESEIKTDKV